MPDWTKDLYVLRYHWKWVALLVVLVVGSILLVRLAWATTVLKKSFPNLVHEADTIAIGTVTATATEQKQDVPYTLVTFTNLDILKGDDTLTELTLRILGGPGEDGLILNITGVPEFALGDRVIVFVVGNETQAVPFVGMWQGVYRVRTDPRTGQEFVTTHDGQPVHALPSDHAEPIVTFGHESPQTQRQTLPPFPLDEFVNAITQEARREQTK